MWEGDENLDLGCDEHISFVSQTSKYIQNSDLVRAIKGVVLEGAAQVF